MFALLPPKSGNLSQLMLSLSVVDWNGCQMDMFVNFFVYHTVEEMLNFEGVLYGGQTAFLFFHFFYVGHGQ